MGAEPPAAPAARPPTRRRPLLEQPLLWLGLMVGGVVLAVVLSFVVEKTDLSGGRAGDIGHYCQQVAVIKRAGPLTLVTSGNDLTQVAGLVQELRALEKVAPSNVSDDVHEVRTAAEQVQSAMKDLQRSGGTSAASMASTLQQAEARSEDAITQMTEFTQEVCGVDLRPTSTNTVPTVTPPVPTVTPPVPTATPSTR